MTRRTAAQTDAMPVFVPVSIEDLSVLAAEGRLGGDHEAVTVTQELGETFSVELDSEEAQLAALQIAAVVAMARGTRRVGLVGAPNREQLAPGGDTANGMVTVHGLVLRQITAFFDSAPSPLEEQLTKALVGADIDTAWEHGGVQELASDSPLQWHDISELSAYVAGHK